MSLRLLPRRSSVLASVLAATSVALAVASCSHITPLGPDPTQLPPARHLASPIIVQVMRVQAATTTGRCLAGWVAVSLPAGGGPKPVTTAVPVGPPKPVTTAVPSGSPQPVTTAVPVGPAGSSSPAPSTADTCYRPTGTPVRITSASLSAVGTFVPPPDQPNGPDMYGFIVAVPSADEAAVTAAIKQAYDTGSAVGITVAGKLWQAPMVFKPFPGQRLEISFLSRNQARRLYRLLVPSG